MTPVSYFYPEKNIYTETQYENHLTLLSKGKRNWGSDNPLRIQHLNAM